MAASLLRADGSIEVIVPANGKRFTLEELQGFVGGYIELVPIDVGKQRYDMIINEEGKLRDMPYNTQATQLFRVCVNRSNDYIVGDAVFMECECGEDEEDDEDE